MASYSSDFDLILELTEEKLIDIIAKKFSIDLGCNETGYTAYIFGITDKDEFGGSIPPQQFVYEIDDSGYARSHLDENQNMNRVAELIKNKMTTEHENRKKEKTLAAELERKKQQLQTEAYEKKQLEQLKKKYEQSN